MLRIAWRFGLLLGAIGFGETINSRIKLPKAHAVDFARREPHGGTDAVIGGELQLAVSGVAVGAVSASAFPTGSSLSGAMAWMMIRAAKPRCS